MKQILHFIIIFISLHSSAQNRKVDTLLFSGNPLNSINLIITGDGFTYNQQTQLTIHGNEKTNIIFSTPPFIQYKSFFNIFLIHTISTDSGIKHSGGLADCGTQPIKNPNTALGCYFDWSGIHRYIEVGNKSALTSAITSLLPWYNTSTSTNVFPIVICNTPYYGGGEYGSSITCTLDPNSDEILLHELGHAIAGLGDEYAYSSETYNSQSKFNPNSFILWHPWFNNETPATDGINAGLYPDANNGVHPYPKCKMNSLGYPYCPYCIQQFVRAFTFLVNPIQSYLPSSPTLTLSVGSTQTFALYCIQDNPNTIDVLWTLDGIPVGNGFIFALQNDLTTPGRHTLVATVQDGTKLSKTVMKQYTQTWVVTTVAKINTVNLAVYPQFKILSYDNYRVNLNWPGIPTPSGYKSVLYDAYRSTDGGSTWVAASLGMTGTTTSLTRLSAKTQYLLKMRVGYVDANNKVTYGNFSTSQTFLTLSN